jgi:hypothetical protein
LHNRNQRRRILFENANLNFGAVDKFPLVQNAACEANLQSHKVVDGICRLITPAKMVTLTSKELLPTVKQAEQMMSDARALLEKLKITEGDYVKALGKLDVRVILYTLKLQHDADSYDNLAQIGNVTFTIYIRICVHMI